MQKIYDQIELPPIDTDKLSTLEKTIKESIDGLPAKVLPSIKNYESLKRDVEMEAKITSKFSVTLIHMLLKNEKTISVGAKRGLRSTWKDFRSSKLFKKKE